MWQKTINQSKSANEAFFFRINSLVWWHSHGYVNASSFTIKLHVKKVSASMHGTQKSIRWTTKSWELDRNFNYCNVNPRFSSVETISKTKTSIILETLSYSNFHFWNSTKQCLTGRKDFLKNSWNSTEFHEPDNGYGTLIINSSAIFFAY